MAVSVPVYITNRNLLSGVRGMVEYLSRVPGADPVIIDCASTYEPLLAWYESGCPVKVHRLPYNAGNRAAWQFLDEGAPFFVFTDGDFDLSGIPTDCLDVLRGGLGQYPGHQKAGFSQRTDDIPDTPLKPGILAEQRANCRRRRLSGLWWEGEIDSSFALHRQSYRPYYTCPRWGPLGHFGPSLLSEAPYRMRHLSWYVTPENLTDEWRYCLARGDRGVGVWSHAVADYLKVAPVA